MPAAMMQGTRLFDVLHSFGGVASVTPPHYFLNFPCECGFRLFCFVSTPKLYKFGLVSSVCLFGLGCYRETFTSRLFSLSLLSPPPPICTFHEFLPISFSPFDRKHDLNCWHDP